MEKKYDNIKIIISNSIGFLKFNRPDQLNAMNRKMMEEIIDGISEINKNEEVKVAVIIGEGRAFMVGADIKEYGSQSPEEFKSFQNRGFQLYESIENSSKPWLAAVNGFALGGGFEIALSCDMILAAESALLGFPEVFLGLIPGGGGTQRLIQKLGINRVKEMLFLGGQYSANSLLDWGIVNRVFEDSKFQSEVSEFAEKLSRRSKKSIAQLKRLINLSVTEIPFLERLRDEGKTVYNLFYDDEAQLAIKKFINKN
ncbi:MAG: enoyl-CoA hydratase/isomerase family protein [Melioribacteraceae bacterium]